jgi:Resolvase, N terminal domain
MQLRELREYCGRRGREIVGEYVDVGVSGAKDFRRAIASLDPMRPRPPIHGVRQSLAKDG